MIVATVFLSILNQMEFHLVQNRKENCPHDHIPFNVKGNGNIVFSVHGACLQMEPINHRNEYENKKLGIGTIAAIEKNRTTAIISPSFRAKNRTTAITSSSFTAKNRTTAITSPSFTDNKRKTVSHRSSFSQKRIGQQKYLVPVLFAVPSRQFVFHESEPYKI